MKENDIKNGMDLLAEATELWNCRGAIYLYMKKKGKVIEREAYLYHRDARLIEEQWNPGDTIAIAETADGPMILHCSNREGVYCLNTVWLSESDIEKAEKIFECNKRIREDKVSKMYQLLSEFYEDSGAVSQATLFNRAFHDGLISYEMRDCAKNKYGDLWNYVGD